MNGFKRILTSRSTGIVIGIIIGFVLAMAFISSPSQHDLSQQVDIDDNTASEPASWTCSMHPQIKQPDPGKCPICGMDLIPLTSSGEDEGSRRLKMSLSAMKLAEIQTVPVRREFVEHELRLAGKVEYDETRLKYITAWFPGRLDRLFVDYTGIPVKKGDHLVEIYSPSLLTDQEALIQALQASKTLGNSTIAQVRSSRLEVLERARERLRLLGLTDRQIQEIEKRGSPSNRVTFYSPMDGIVIHKNALEGDYVRTGSRIYTIADLSQVWMKMDAYESDLPWIHYGQEVEFTTVSYPGDVFRGRISFVDPFLNERSRTVKVRVNVANTDGRLKPDMFVRAIVRAKVNAKGEILDLELMGKWISPMHPEIIKDEPGTCDICGMPLVKAETLGYVDADKNIDPPLVIPDSAPLITGARAVVYVKLSDAETPAFEGREIVLGPRLKDHYIVLSGLNEGEEIVVKGNFKIDSALQIEAKPSMMSPDGEGRGSSHKRSDTVEGSSAERDNAPPILPSSSIPDFLYAYQSMWSAFVSDDLKKAQNGSHEWVDAARKHSLNEIEKIGHNVMHAAGIEDARQSFGEMSELLVATVEKHGSPTDSLYLAFCPMAFDNKGARWLQWDKEIKNPYFGNAMLNCGEIKKTFSPRENDSHQHNH